MDSLTSLLVLTLLYTADGNTVHYHTGRNLTQVPTDAIPSDAHTVRLSHNRISRLGSGFTSAPYIRYLFIDDNRVNNLSPQTFHPLRKLLVLDLDRNFIVSLRDSTFSALATLSDLILSNNLISAVSARAFHGLTSLEFLELSGNRLSVVPAQAVRLVPSERLLLVLLMLNNISRIPGDITSLHPSASYQFHGNPLHCPDETLNSSRDDMFYVDNMPRWPVMWSYVIETEGSRRFAGKFFFIKSRHEHFGVAPNTFLVNEHHDVRLPEVPTGKYAGYPTAWITPTGRHRAHGKALTVQNFTADDAGLYRYVRDVPGTAMSGQVDLLLCLHRPAEDGQEPEKTTTSPPADFSPQDRKNGTADICVGSTNQSCCFNGSGLPSFHPEFCDAGSTNTDSTLAKPVPTLILGIVSVIFATLMMLFPAALFRWRKRGRRGENGGTVGATLRAAGAQSMAVCIPLHPLPRLTELRGTDWAGMNLGAVQLHRVAGASPADTIGTIEAQVHHYENTDADEYASAAPPPLPGDGETAADAVNTGVPEGVPEQPAFQIGEDLDMPYGVAAANALYHDQREGTAPNPSTSVLANEHTSSADLAEATYSATDANQAHTITTDLHRQQTAHTEHIAAEANTPLRRQCTAPNRRSLTSEHARSGTQATYGATDANQAHTITTDLYRQQTAHTEHIAPGADTPLCRQCTAPNRRSLTFEHPRSGTEATYGATDDNRKGTVTVGLYGQQID
ncbi:PREDICTED: uncharacterized protein LOC109488232 [Branchiostoma belcheri]|uniref:Uncharacterized protein LOC109488232 n=1 Tax=Branchiostoma belcheri TaxID=7741 RepID=A0A6P5A433_BRABE|nr:PREDICTED: uncharacterized protein LOC109488232 [Branchiostoma belcheri]XP_019648001.1 PREDICTED: uncharacterized protein LOC109488232 [Branchiostoma belcheri]XP_019648002.1 PREDICTED: uncharacterized protein LOC109488232 [Branchiostoma belcheri]